MKSKENGNGEKYIFKRIGEYKLDEDELKRYEEYAIECGHDNFDDLVSTLMNSNISTIKKLIELSVIERYKNMFDLNFKTLKKLIFDFEKSFSSGVLSSVDILSLSVAKTYLKECECRILKVFDEKEVNEENEESDTHMGFNELKELLVEYEKGFPTVDKLSRSEVSESWIEEFLKNYKEGKNHGK